MLLAGLIQALVPVVFIPGFGCEIVQGALFRCPGNPDLESLVQSGSQIAVGSFITVPLGVVLFLTCRWFVRRRPADRAS